MIIPIFKLAALETPSLNSKNFPEKVEISFISIVNASTSKFSIVNEPKQISKRMVSKWKRKRAKLCYCWRLKWFWSIIIGYVDQISESLLIAAIKFDHIKHAIYTQKFDLLSI
jgi:hypothetical protein